MISQVSLEASHVVGNEWTEAELSILRENEADYEEVHMSPTEMYAVYQCLKRYYEQGIWSMGSVSDYG